jgi:hypothetical protein
MAYKRSFRMSHFGFLRFVLWEAEAKNQERRQSEIVRPGLLTLIVRIFTHAPQAIHLNVKSK